MSVVRLACLAGALAIGMPSRASWAAVTLSVRVVRGGLDLEFGTVEPGTASRTEELELTVTSTGGSQYRVSQELPGSLVNERGDRLPEGALVMQLSRGLTGSLASGGIVPVTEHPQELFVSNTAGTSDSLLAAYSIAPVPGLLAGSYRGLLRFTAQSRDTGAIATETMRVEVVVGSTVRLERVGIGPSRLTLGELEPGERSRIQELVLAVVNNSGTPTQITQELVEPLTNGRGDVLALESLQYAVTSAAQGSSWGTVEKAPQVIIEDAQSGSQPIRLTYAVTIPSNQPAGLYHGTLRLRLLHPGASAGDELLVPLELTVREVFTLVVKPADAASGRLHFSAPAPGETSVERSVVVEIRTNVGRAYQVLGGLNHPLVLESGDILPASALVWSVPHTEHGSALIAPNTPVTVGYEPVYQSDANGSPDSFVVTYRLTIPPDARSGQYSGQLHFTITLF